ERAQLLPDHLGHRTADASVDFVENHAADRVLAQGRDFDGQVDACQLAARGDLAQRAGWLARIGADQQFAALSPLQVRLIRFHRLQFDPQYAADHAEIAHQGRNLVTQPGGGCAARLAQSGCRSGVLVVQQLALDGQLFQHVAGTVEFGQLCAQRHQLVVQFLRRQPIAAGERVQVAEVLVDLGVTGGVQVHILGIVPQAVGRLAQLDAGVVEHFQPGAQLVVQGCELLEFGMRPVQRAPQCEIAVAIEQFDDAGTAFRQPARVGQALVTGVEFGQFGGGQRPLLQLVQLVAQQFDALLAVLATAEFVDALVQFAPLSCLQANLRQQFVVPGVGVEQGELVRARQQCLMLVLAMDFHQQGRQFAKLSRIGRATVYPGFGTALCAQDPPKLAGTVFVQFFTAQPFTCLVQVGKVELRRQFDLADLHEAREWLRREELDEDGACQLRRVLRAEGSSKAWINGRPANARQLGELASLLVEIHGQHEHQALLSRPHQLALLDAYAGHDELLAQIRLQARQWRELNQRIHKLSGGEDREQRIELLRHELDELEKWALPPAELAELDASHKRLANAGRLAEGSAGIVELLDGDGDFALRRTLDRAHAELEKLAALDDKLCPWLEMLDNAGIQLGEAADGLGHYAQYVDLDPARCAEVDEHLGHLHALSRRYRLPPEELHDKLVALRAELAELEGAGDVLEQLANQRQLLHDEYAQTAAGLSQSRSAAATRLGDEVSA